MRFMARVVKRKSEMEQQWCPGRRELHPHLGTVSPCGPALVGPWEIAQQCRALWSVELRIPATRGIRPDASSQE